MEPMGHAGRCVGLAVTALVLGGLVGGCGIAAPGDGSVDGSSAATGAPGSSVTALAPSDAGSTGDPGDPAGSVGPGGSAGSARQPRSAGGQEAAALPIGPSFPLTLRRVGGIADFDDRIVLESNGRLRVDTASVRGRVCTLTTPQRRQLVPLLASLRLGAPISDVPTPEATAVDAEAVTESEPITISVTDDHARAVDLSDPSLGEISGLVDTLVGDVTLTAPAVTRCTTPAAPSVASAP